VLIKRTERQARRNSLQLALADRNGGGLDRRTFLRRSGIAAGSLAALGALQLGSVRKAEAGPPRRAPPSSCARTCARIARSAAP
jgi:formate dehydrogenase major subunit